MPTLYPLTRPQALTSLRIDLSDTDGSGYRWPDSALDRALEKSVERYSGASPLLQALQLATVPHANLYALPAGAFYVDRVEYPSGHWPKRFVPFLERKSPFIAALATFLMPPLVTFTAGGSLAAGPYGWAVTFTVPGGGETTPSPVWTATSSGPGQAAVITGIPTGPYGVSGRSLYRTAAGGSSLALAGSIPDNVTTVFVDGAADGELGTPAPSENTTANLDQVELQIPPELWPADSAMRLELTYAARHLLDGAGTTIPERHWETVFLGALAYAMWSYLPQVNDNFEYADGHLHDRVDDTKSTVAWQTQCRQAMADYERRLALIKDESNAAGTGLSVWGDKPLRWERL